MKIIGGLHRGRVLFAPKGKAVRPSTSRLRESLFDICGSLEGAHFLDLFAGSGSIGCEAISRGAAHVTFVDKSRESAALIAKNISLIGENQRTTLHCMNVFEALKMFVKKKREFHLIFADPPYGEGYSNEVLVFIDSHHLLAPGGRLFLEDSLQKTAPPLLQSLKLISSRKIGDAELREYELIN